MVAFYLTHVSTLLLISSQTKKKQAVKLYCTAWMYEGTRSNSGPSFSFWRHRYNGACSITEFFKSRVFIDYVNRKNRKAIKLSNMNMATDLKQALVGFHAFTGNDYVSSFFAKGKTATWKKMVKDEKYIQEFREFGMS